ncbi:D-2-hydroxyacid dehydrogenase [Falsiroseomonas tokyonensis]|uniref:D-2-hydroxyacid dehydrogenase n=1 Tax=Falsiroseomonas tokyonensis TaxID=430521 RepID=A0ABV7C036_9PROT|nr:D-2-hydroxyacid dehydrogenase [Falsiroseomonas tokyonensis]MBU8541149.1 D-2-hydroxyacid dehydrogenase [Falsiroseomonas tokyonensis]
MRLHAHVNPASPLAAIFFESRIQAALPDGVALSFSASPEGLEEGLATAEVLLLVGQAPLQDLPRRAPHLRWISYASAGVEWLLQAGLPDGVTLTNASGTHISKAAEFALLSVLMLHNRLPHFATAQRAHRWAPQPVGTVAGRTVLVLGMGALGGAAATALARQGMRVIGNSQSGRPHPDVAVMTQGDGFRAWLPQADVLLIALPLTPATHGLIGRAELDLLPPHAGVVNIGRGEILDAEALAAKLQEGSLSGAVLDALPQEPLPADSPLWDTPNLVITPHCGLYDPAEYAPRCLDAFAANLARFREGEALHQVVDRARGY